MVEFTSLKLIKIMQQFIYLFECCKVIFTVQLKLLDNTKIKLFDLNTDKIKHKNISAYYTFALFKEIVTYHSSIQTFAKSFFFLLL